RFSQPLVGSGGRTSVWISRSCAASTSGSRSTDGTPLTMSTRYGPLRQPTGLVVVPLNVKVAASADTTISPGAEPTMRGVSRYRKAPVAPGPHLTVEVVAGEETPHTSSANPTSHRKPPTTW